MLGEVLHLINAASWQMLGAPLSFRRHVSHFCERSNLNNFFSCGVFFFLFTLFMICCCCVLLLFIAHGLFPSTYFSPFVPTFPSPRIAAPQRPTLPPVLRCSASVSTTSRAGMWPRSPANTSGVFFRPQMHPSPFAPAQATHQSTSIRWAIHCRAIHSRTNWWTPTSTRKTP